LFVVGHTGPFIITKGVGESWLQTIAPPAAEQYFMVVQLMITTTFSLLVVELNHLMKKLVESFTFGGSPDPENDKTHLKVPLASTKQKYPAPLAFPISRNIEKFGDVPYGIMPKASHGFAVSLLHRTEQFSVEGTNYSLNSSSMLKDLSNWTLQSKNTFQLHKACMW
jgi:hypothetical protein